MAAQSQTPTPRSHSSGNDDAVVQVALVADTLEAFEKFAAETHPEFACEGARRDPEGRVTAEIFTTRAGAERASKADGISAEIVADGASAATEADVDYGNPFEDHSTLPTARGVLIRDTPTPSDGPTS